MQVNNKCHVMQGKLSGMCFFANVDAGKGVV